MQSDALNAAHAINRAGCEQQQAGACLAAIDCYRRALVIFEQAGDVQARIMVLNNEGETYCQMGDGAQAAAVLRQAQVLIDGTTGTDFRLVGAVLGHQGWAAALAGDLDSAEGLLLRGLHVVRQHGDSAAQEREMLTLLSTVLDRRSDHAAADQIRL